MGMELPESAFLTNNRAVWQACPTGQQQDWEMVSLHQESKTQQRQQCQLGQAVGRAGHPWQQADREPQARTCWRRMSSCSGNSGTGRPTEGRCSLVGGHSLQDTSSGLHGTHSEGLLGLPRSSSCTALTPTPPTATARGRHHTETKGFSFGGIIAGKRQFSTALRLPRQAQPSQACKSMSFTLQFQQRPECCWQPWQPALAGCGTGAVDAIGAPGTAPTWARTHSAAVCTVCTHRDLTTAFTLFRMEKTPLYTSSQKPLCSQFTWELSF